MPLFREWNELYGSVSLGTSCLVAPLADPEDPACVVEDLTREATGAAAVVQLPRCLDTRYARPCWRVEPNEFCRADADFERIVVDRPPEGAPRNTSTRGACACVPPAVTAR